jgi:MFS family permease
MKPSIIDPHVSIGTAPLPGRQVRLRTGPFVLLLLSAFGFYASFMMFLATLPVYAAETLQMSEGQIGLLMAAFAATAMGFKPHAGWALDVWGRRPLLLAGAGVFLLAAPLYMVAGGMWSLVVLRVFHGVGMGLFPTAGAAVVADLAPPDRRGEGMGYFSATGSLGFALGPVLGMTVVNATSFPVMCVWAGGLALGSLACAWRLPETGTRVAVAPPPLTLDGLFSRQAMRPSLILFCLFVSYGGIMTFVPLLAREAGLRNPGWFFVVVALVILVLRAKGGTLSDRFGRVPVIAPSLAVAGLAVAGLGFQRTVPGILAAGVLFAAGFGIASPALMAMATDGVAPEERGRAMGTLQTAWEMGNGTGALLLGQILSWSGGRFGLTYALSGAITIAGAALALLGRRRRL